MLEILEERWLPSPIWVSNTNGSGPGSLSDAIMAANSSPGSVIDFDIGTGGPAVIIPQSGLTIDKGAGTIIDGTSQPGYSGTPLIDLEGASSGQAGYDGLTITAANCTIRGLVINSFANGITIQGSGATGNVVTGCYIGTNAAGTAAQANLGYGIDIDGANGNTIGGTASGDGNVCSGNDGAGINITGGGSNNLVEGNVCGLNAAGTAAQANSSYGIEINGANNNTIGGTASGAGNVCSGNSFAGINVTGGAANNLVEGNLCGLDVSGNKAFPNHTEGIAVQGGATANTIGGTVSGAGNVCSGNGRDGLYISDNTTTGNVAYGNIIGLNGTPQNPTMNATVPNGLDGVLIRAGAQNNIIGSGDVPPSGNNIGSANIIGGNNDSGIHINEAHSSGNIIQGCYIGTTPQNLTAVSPFDLGDRKRGIFIDSASGNIVGGTAPGDGNIIDANGETVIDHTGILIASSGTDSTVSNNNLVQGNYIADNTGYGVRIGRNASHNIIGGTAAGAANTITGNGLNGVQVDNYNGKNLLVGTAGIGNEILGNSITEAPLQPDGNPNLNGIYLFNAGTHGFANDGQAAPALTAAYTSTGSSYVTGTLTSTPDTPFLLEFFASAQASPPEGQVYLTPDPQKNPNLSGGDVLVMTDPSGQASFAAYLALPVPADDVVTATATDNAAAGTSGAGDTSQFSAAIDLTPDAAPNSSINALPAYSRNTTFTVSYTASDPGSNPSGLFEVDVYAKGPTDSGYNQVKTFTGSSLGSGSFTYDASEGDGSYSFYSIATDNAGSTQPLPNPLAEATTLIDTTPPTSKVNALPISTNSITVTYTANDAGSGLAEVDIYAKGPTDSGYSLAHGFTGGNLTSGSFNYNVGEGDGNYSFYSVATDNAGNAETTNSAQTSTLLDTTTPVSSATSPQYSSGTSFTISYTASDPGSQASGLAEVDVYAKGPTDSGYNLAKAFTGANLGSGSFTYKANEGDGSYSFYSIATDNAGNGETTSTAQTSTLLDTTKPMSTANSPAKSSSKTFTVSFTASDPGSDPSGLAEVDIFVKGPSDNGYSLAKVFTGSSLGSGSFSYNAGEGDGTYAFYSLATDKAGNSETTTSAQASTVLDTRIRPAITWTAPSAIAYGTSLGAAQLDASAGVAGTFVYSPAVGTVLSAGNNQTLSVTFTPTDTTDYAPVTATASINVTQATPTVSWSNPADLGYGVALSATQLDASTSYVVNGVTVNVPGTFIYSPAAGTILQAGNGQTLSVTFTPTDTTDYSSATAAVSINVSQAVPTIPWADPGAIIYGTALGGTQLDAAASYVVGGASVTVPGTFTYTPAAGTVLGVGAGQVLSVSFTPSDATDYVAASAVASIDVTQATPVLYWSNPASISYGTPLSSTQLDASASYIVAGAIVNVTGTFAYTPAAGTVLNAGNNQTLSVAFTPTDTNDYATDSGSAAINVLKATPQITWSNPAGITFGTALSAAQLDATADVPGTFVYTPALGTVLGAGTNQTLSVTFTPADTANYAATAATVAINVARGTPAVTWSNPGPIVYGTALDSTQLDASASYVVNGASQTVPGTFAYTPPAGTVLGAGNNLPLEVTFTPADSTDYVAASDTVSIDVSQATPAITWNAPAAIAYGTPLGSAQLDATATYVVNGNTVMVAGTFTYTPAAGTVLGAGTGQNLQVSFTPADTTDYAATSAMVSIDVNKALPTITWSNPAPIVYGTALGSMQLDATASVPGTLTYTPAAGTVLGTGKSQTLSVTFTPSNTADYLPTTATVAIDVIPATPIITWNKPAPITYGTALGSAQLDASANLPGTFVYTPPAGTLLGAGNNQVLSASFTPTDPADYAAVMAGVTIDITQATPTITWANPVPIVYGTPLGAAQLDAAANVPGTFAYTPAAGTVLNPGNATLTATFTPADSVNYKSVTDSVALIVSKATPTITWPGPEPIKYGTPLTGTQLDATASFVLNGTTVAVQGFFFYSPKTGTVLPSGNDSLAVVFAPSDRVHFNGATATTTIAVMGAPKFTSAGRTVFAVGAPGSFTVTTSGFPAATLSESHKDKLPAGVTFAAATGTLSGTPAANTVGTYHLHFSATNSVGKTVAQTFTLIVGRPPHFTSAAAATFTVGRPAKFRVTVSAFPNAVLSEDSGDTLPKGVKFHAGVLSGTPAKGTTGTYLLHFTAHNGAGGDVTQTFTLTVGQPAAFTSVPRVSFTEGVAGTFTVITAGFPRPTLSENKRDKLPAGITFDAALGILSGTPDADVAGTYQLHFSARNGVGKVASQVFTLTILP